MLCLLPSIREPTASMSHESSTNNEGKEYRYMTALTPYLLIYLFHLFNNSFSTTHFGGPVLVLKKDRLLLKSPRKLLACHKGHGCGGGR